VLKMLAYLLGEGVVTAREMPDAFSDETRCLPKLTDTPCVSEECDICEKICPTNAIARDRSGDGAAVSIDLSACINCSLCISACPSKTIVSDKRISVARATKDDLLLSTAKTPIQPASSTVPAQRNLFKRSIACRVVSTGCSACDLELSASGNPIFDMERFGITVVASPRFADVLLVTGPVPKAMHEALKSCYMAMSDPRKVVAVGTCACSGGIHRGGYAEANGVAGVLPVDLYIPGCPPHPWSIVEGLFQLMGRQGG